jgi:hypothetical protein
MESERGFRFLSCRGFLARTGFHPRIKFEDMLRWKTL